MIYWSIIDFNQTVYSTGLGFTNQLYTFVRADNEIEAHNLVHNYFTKQLKNDKFGTQITHVKIEDAIEQNPSRYIHLINRSKNELLRKILG